MNKLDKIQYITRLERKKKELEAAKQKVDNQIDDINIEIKKQEDSCFHIYVKLLRECGIDICKCILCGKEVTAYSIGNEVINAESFMSSDFSGIFTKYEYIRNIAYGFLQENPNMTTIELYGKLKRFIEKNISSKQTQTSIDSSKVKTKV